ncbi:hypothetical protein C8F04DRAFT_1185686 [Mycena alexandri]|uniref:Uncharacterized protein n=1 Tax=Mycena alexandri TaxID=1745969 RepID=A0AAD6X1V4_9AGAR|nr:hypothetical protein C8F04DRAFT_1185686 [Mycena alexandri]
MGNRLNVHHLEFPLHSESDFDLKSEDNHTFASRIISTLAKDTIERRVKAYELHKATLEKEASIRDPPGLEPMAEIDPHNLSAVPHQGEAAPLDDQIDTWYGSIYSARAWIFENEKWLQQPHSERLPWSSGLVTLEDSDIVFPQSSLTLIGRTITRPVSTGFAVLDERRQSQIIIQPSTMAFAKQFDLMTDNLLKNLDWNNVFVAGGIVLGTLLSLEHDRKALDYATDHWESSDIDVYIYGLSAADATIKAQSIYDTFRANLPDVTPSCVVKNTRTITFYTRYPLRRVQIVLKLGKTPKDILVNFDLDICAMGWDGSTVWMLPRAARALESSVNPILAVWMQCIHYESYPRPLSFEPPGNPTSTDYNISFRLIISLFKYANKGYGLRFLASYVSPDSQQLVQQSRRWATEKFQDMTSKRGDGYILRHSDLLPHSRSCLRGFSSFMRSVAYWELAQINNPSIGSYLFDNRFSHAGLKDYINRSNRLDVSKWLETDGILLRLRGYGVRHGDELDDAQRITFASRLDGVLDSAANIRLPLLLPLDFVDYANTMVKQMPGLGDVTILIPVVSSIQAQSSGHAGEGLFFWIIPSALMWQQDTRHIDELFEVLFAFRRANINTPLQSEDLQRGKFIELSRHEALTAGEDEIGAFKIWMAHGVDEEGLEDSKALS